MSIKKLAIMIMAVTLLFTGCSSSASTAPDYMDTITLIKTYEDSYRDYVQNGEGQVAMVTSVSETPNGAPCNVRYTAAVDQPFTSCSLEVQRNDRIEYDEYFNISDTLMMAVRTYINADGYAIITKYVSTNGNFYIINDETSTCDLVEDIVGLDFFMTWEQVTTAYAGEGLE